MEFTFGKTYTVLDQSGLDQVDSVRALVLHMTVFADSRPLMPVPTAAPLNPFQSAGRRKHDTTDGKTSGLSIQRSGELFRSIDTAYAVGLCGRSLLGTFAMRDSETSVTDLPWQGDRKVSTGAAQ